MISMIMLQENVKVLMIMLQENGSLIKEGKGFGNIE